MLGRNFNKIGAARRLLLSSTSSSSLLTPSFSSALTHPRLFSSGAKSNPAQPDPKWANKVQGAFQGYDVMAHRDYKNLFPPQGPYQGDIRLDKRARGEDGIYRRPQWADPTQPLSDEFDTVWYDLAAPEPLADANDYIRKFSDWWSPSIRFWGGVWVIIGIIYLYTENTGRTINVTPREFPYDNIYRSTGYQDTEKARSYHPRYPDSYIEWMAMKHEAGQSYAPLSQAELEEQVAKSHPQYRGREVVLEARPLGDHIDLRESKGFIARE
jgi:hypothetical protein